MKLIVRKPLNLRLLIFPKSKTNKDKSYHFPNVYLDLLDKKNWLIKNKENALVTYDYNMYIQFRSKSCFCSY